MLSTLFIGLEQPPTHSPINNATRGGLSFFKAVSPLNVQINVSNKPNHLLCPFTCSDAFEKNRGDVSPSDVDLERVSRWSVLAANKAQNHSRDSEP